MEITGYGDRFGVAPGERVELKLSIDPAGPYEAQLVELLHGDEHPDGPGFQERVVGSAIDGRHDGRPQRADAGSCLVVDDGPGLGGDAIEIEVWAWPTLPAAGHVQTIAARGTSWAVGLDADGRLAAWLADADAPVARHEDALPARRWVRVRARIDVAAGAVTLTRELPEPDLGVERVATTTGRGRGEPAAGPLVWAGAIAPAGIDRHFNGKLEAPVLRDGDGGLLAAWDLARDPERTVVADTGPSSLHGRLVNRPMRAVTGHAWDGTTMDFRCAPEQYAAISFREDDLDDAAWTTDLALDVPADLPSGVYAVRVRAHGLEDHVAFAVGPPRGRATAPVALVLPTFSYMAYANDHVLRLRDEAWKYVGLPVAYDPLDEQVERHPEWGRSLYDTHRDGTGCCQSSRLRPIVNLRPRYRWWASGGAQYLASDLYVVHWLRHAEVPFDVLTDEDVHREGADLLGRYRTVLTGTHPEYVTAEMLDGFAGYLAGGGHLMYLGANGFYWVTSTPPETSHVIEVRRGNAGTRAWDSEPGEEHHAFTGERGGLWRHRGRSPNRLVGIGFAAQGWSDPSPGYRRTEASRDPAVSWIFDGVEGDVIGDFGLAMNGAAGDELDRFDPALGSPPQTVVLASSGGHSRYYAVVHEDLLQTSADVTGETNPNVRADLVYFETTGGGAVFSVGSKSWCASLSWRGYDNSVARVTENVLRRFMGDR